MTSRKDRFRPLAPAIPIVLSIMAIAGPYILGPIRLEHVFVYSFALMFLVRSLLFQQYSLFPPGFLSIWKLLIPLVWLGILFLSFLGHFLEYRARLPDWRSFASGVDSFLLPLSAFFLVQVLTSRVGRAQASSYVGFSLISVLTANTLIAGISAVWGRSPALEWFAVGDDSGESVASKSPEQFLGVFNQPAEAGLTYALATVWFICFFPRRSPWLGFLVITSLSIGGFLSLSKVFSIGGLVMAIIVAASFRKLWVFAPTMLALTTGFLITAPFHRFRTFERLLGSNNSEDPVWVLTAGRLGNSTTGPSLISQSEQRLTNAPFLGYGPSGINGAGITLDSAFLHIVTIAGPVGLFLWALIFFLCGLLALLSKEQQWRVFGLACFVLLLGASLGFEPLSSNRAGTVSMMMMSLIAQSSPGELDIRRSSIVASPDSKPKWWNRIAR